METSQGLFPVGFPYGGNFSQTKACQEALSRGRQCHPDPSDRRLIFFGCIFCLQLPQIKASKQTKTGAMRKCPLMWADGRVGMLFSLAVRAYTAAAPNHGQWPPLRASSIIPVQDEYDNHHGDCTLALFAFFWCGAARCEQFQKIRLPKLARNRPKSASADLKVPQKQPPSRLLLVFCVLTVVPKIGQLRPELCPSWHHYAAAIRAADLGFSEFKNTAGPIS